MEEMKTSDEGKKKKGKESIDGMIQTKKKRMDDLQDRTKKLEEQKKKLQQSIDELEKKKVDAFCEKLVGLLKAKGIPLTESGLETLDAALSISSEAEQSTSDAPAEDSTEAWNV